MNRLDILRTAIPSALITIGACKHSGELMEPAQNNAKLGVFAVLEAAPGQTEAVAELLQKGHSIVQEEEPQTLHWFALKIGPSTFAVFDTFESEAGRTAHLTGRIPEALKANEKLFAKPPSIRSLKVLAAKEPQDPGSSFIYAAHVELVAKIGKEEAAAKFLIEGNQIVTKTEPQTEHWFGVQFDERTFAVFDTFSTEEGREAHFRGKVAAALGKEGRAIFESVKINRSVHVLTRKTPR